MIGHRGDSKVKRLDEVQSEHPGKKIEVWFQNEARLGLEQYNNVDIISPKAPPLVGGVAFLYSH